MSHWWVVTSVTEDQVEEASVIRDMASLESFPMNERPENVFRGLDVMQPPQPASGVNMEELAIDGEVHN